jgi:hypothetical protein
MKLSGIFGATFVSVLAALIIYDLLVKGLVAGFMPSNKYDNTFNPEGEIDSLRNAIENENRLIKIGDKYYRIRNAA